MSQREADGEGSYQDSVLDEVGVWSQIKLEIIRKYAKAYSTILNNQPSLSHCYIDAFCGAGIHKAKSTKEFVSGSPLIALETEPPFKHYVFIDLNAKKASLLRDNIGERKNVTIFEGDCNVVLLDKVLPKMTWQSRKRALCLLDPYGLHLNWDVIERAGRLKTVEIFLNFPVADMNRNVLWRRDPTGVKESQIKRLDTFYGDETWRDEVYDTAGDLFGHPEKVLNANDKIVQAFRRRLKKVAGFKHVPEPIPMRNSIGMTVYYLFFASHNDTGLKIVKHIFDTYRNWGNS